MIITTKSLPPIISIVIALAVAGGQWARPILSLETTLVLATGGHSNATVTDHDEATQPIKIKIVVVCALVAFLLLIVSCYMVLMWQQKAVADYKKKFDDMLKALAENKRKVEAQLRRAERKKKRAAKRKQFECPDGSNSNNNKDSKNKDARDPYASVDGDGGYTIVIDEGDGSDGDLNEEEMLMEEQLGLPPNPRLNVFAKNKNKDGDDREGDETRQQERNRHLLAKDGLLQGKPGVSKGLVYGAPGWSPPLRMNSSSVLNGSGSGNIPSDPRAREMSDAGPSSAVPSTYDRASRRGEGAGDSLAVLQDLAGFSGAINSGLGSAKKAAPLRHKENLL